MWNKNKYHVKQNGYTGIGVSFVRQRTSQCLLWRRMFRCSISFTYKTDAKNRFPLCFISKGCMPWQLAYTSTSGAGALSVWKFILKTTCLCAFLLAEAKINTKNKTPYMTPSGPRASTWVARLEWRRRTKPYGSNWGCALQEKPRRMKSQGFLLKKDKS